MAVALVKHALVEFICEGGSGRLFRVQRTYERVTVGAVLADAAFFAEDIGAIVHDAFLIESSSAALTAAWTSA